MPLADGVLDGVTLRCVACVARAGAAALADALMRPGGAPKLEELNLGLNRVGDPEAVSRQFALVEHWGGRGKEKKFGRGGGVRGLAVMRGTRGDEAGALAERSGSMQPFNESRAGGSARCATASLYFCASGIFSTDACFVSSPEQHTAFRRTRVAADIQQLKPLEYALA
eukprot:3684915-Pleurochrysis_carterae.AAC.1